VGVLTREAGVDVDRLRALVAAANGLPVTFHRAFDLTRDQAGAIDVLAQCGVARVLTSGGAPSAREGADAIGDLVKRAAERSAIMAGGGVREENVPDIVQRSGARE